jgi:hypothetical protein
MRRLKLKRLKITFAIICVFLMTSTILNNFLDVGNAEITGTLPPEYNDWIIANETYASFEDINITGNITITSTGKLTLINCNLTMNSTSNGQFTIQVNSSGELIIINSTVMAYNSSYNYKFKVYGNLTILNSEINNLWGDENPESGIQIYSNDNVTISSSTITNPNGSAIYFKNCSPLIYNNYIFDSIWGIYDPSGNNSNNQSKNNKKWNNMFKKPKKPKKKDLLEQSKSDGSGDDDPWCPKGLRDPPYGEEPYLWYDTFNTENKITSNSNLDIGQFDVKLERGLDEYTVGLWHFEENSGTIAYDEANNNDCQLNGPIYASGKYGRALQFDGIFDNALILNDKNIDISGNITIEAWVMMSGPLDSNGYQRIYSKGSESNERVIELYLEDETATKGTLVFRVNQDSPSSSSIVTYSIPSFQYNTWYHIAAVHNDTNNSIELYVNSLIKATATHNVGIDTGDYNHWIGNRDFYDERAWNGKIDELRISNIARTDFDLDFSSTGELISERINPTPNSQWDKIFLNKLEYGSENNITITVLDGSTSENIAGYENLNNSEIDISDINVIEYPSIKLKAIFSSNGTKSPILVYLAVSWVEENMWRDTFLNDSRISNRSNIKLYDGDVTLNSNIITLSSDEDFEYGVKVGVESHANFTEIPAGELRLELGDIFSDSWEGVLDETWTNYDGDWVEYNANTDPTEATIDDEFMIAGNYVGKMHHDYGSTGNGMVHTIPKINSNDEIILYFKFFSDESGNNQYCTLSIYNGSTQIALVGKYQDEWYYYNGAGLQSSGVYAKEGYLYKLRIKIDFNNDTYDAWLNGGGFNNWLIVDNQTLKANADGANKICLTTRQAWGGTYAHGYFDMLKIGDYNTSGYWRSTEQELLTNYSIISTKLTFANLSNENTLFNLSWSNDNYHNATYNTSITSGESITIIDDNLTSGSFESVLTNFSFGVNLTGDNESTPSLYQVEFLTLENTTGSVTSEAIELPDNYIWDTLYLSKTEEGTENYINITILNGDTNESITGFVNLTGSIIDLSMIDPTIYSSIKLKADFFTNGYQLPILHDWTVMWGSENSFQDTFLGENKIDNMNNMMDQLSYTTLDQEIIELTTTADFDAGSKYEMVTESDEYLVPRVRFK